MEISFPNDQTVIQFYNYISARNYLGLPFNGFWSLGLSVCLSNSPHPSEMVKDTLGDLNTDSFVKLLSKLIGESKYVQNNPPDLIPEEDRIARHVLDSLLPYSTQTGGGPLIVNHVTYFPGRGNVIVEYPGTVPGKILSFVGMHMDVVTANPNDWVSFFYLLSLFSIWFWKLGLAVLDS